MGYGAAVWAAIKAGAATAAGKAVIGAAAAAAGTVAASKITEHRKEDTPVPEIPGAPPKKTDPEIEEAARKERLAQRQRKGRAATILTGTAGLRNEPTLGRKTLLGQ